MKVSLKKTKEAYDIIEKYDGINPYIKTLKYHIFDKKDKILNDLELEYVLKNHNFQPQRINKVVKITKFFGEKCKEKWQTEFVPEKLQIVDLLGETDNTFHAYVRYRKSQDKPVMCFITKKDLLDDFRISDYNDLDINFDKYDEILANYGKSLYEHQKSAVKFLLSRHKIIIADQPGLGKTLSVITASLEGRFKKILIISPASLKSNWKRELKTFVSDDEIGIVNGDNWVYGKKYTIINYDIVNRFYKIPTETIFETKETENGIITIEKIVKSRKKEVKEKARLESKLLLENFDLIIIDEAHKLSNNTSNRYQIIEDFIEKSDIKDIYLMTGTPITNKPLNFLNILTLIGHELSKNWEYYVRTYCDGKQITPRKTGKPIWITSGSSNLEELKEKVKNTYIRRIKDDIPGMVNRNVIDRYYDLTDEEKKQYDNTWAEYEQAQFNIGKTNLNKDLTEGILLRMKVSEFMISRTIELANEILEDGEKIFIGCAFNNEIDKFKEYYSDKCVVYNGSMSTKQKDAAEKKFMTDPKTTVFIGNILASGVGLNLTAASKMIVNSIPYVPGDLIQLIDRLHRLTQTKDVYAYVQLFNDTISERVWSTIIKKQLMINKVIKKEDDK
jgi:SWI/SNF-related matrix-associated actin-dependent regulator 1 of chromatin subfamily A